MKLNVLKFIAYWIFALYVAFCVHLVTTALIDVIIFNKTMGFANLYWYTVPVVFGVLIFFDKKAGE
jgi:hypothetical protein